MFYGTRDPETGRWLSTDPALGKYMAGTKKGEGGIYNQVNFNLCHHSNNNPIKYIDSGEFYAGDQEFFAMMEQHLKNIFFCCVPSEFRRFFEKMVIHTQPPEILITG